MCRNPAVRQRFSPKYLCKDGICCPSSSLLADRLVGREPTYYLGYRRVALLWMCLPYALIVRCGNIISGSLIEKTAPAFRCGLPEISGNFQDTAMKRKIPSVELLIAFETAARHQSFTRAAEELSLTQSAVCRQIAALEDYLPSMAVMTAPWSGGR